MDSVNFALFCVTAFQMKYIFTCMYAWRSPCSMQIYIYSLIESERAEID